MTLDGLRSGTTGHPLNADRHEADAAASTLDPHTIEEHLHDGAAVYQEWRLARLTREQRDAERKERR